MRTAGVICEFNPFHNGHARLLHAMRDAVGSDGCVVCVMSGRFVQRGEPAVADPYLRAAAALYGGADLVVELPFPWSCGSAERFAAAGVSILSRMGVGLLAFGSECGDQALLTAAAKAADQPSFIPRVSALLQTGCGSAAAYAQALRESLGEKAADLPPHFPAPNDMLGIAYLRALTQTASEGTSMRPLIVRREGQAYDDELLKDVSAPSATSMRRLLSEASEDPDVLPLLLEGTAPDAATELLLNAVREGAAPASGDALLPFFHTLFRLSDPAVLSGIAELSGGLSDRVIRAAREASTPQAFVRALHTRLYPDARLRRGMLYAAVGVTPSDVTAPPAYTTLLAAAPRGCALLRSLEKEGRAARKAGQDGDPAPAAPIRVVTKPADAPAGRQRELAEKADALFTLTLPAPSPASSLAKRKPLILTEKT